MRQRRKKEPIHLDSVWSISDIQEKAKTQSWWNRLLQLASITHFQDYLVSVDLTKQWRRHLVWAKQEDTILLDIITNRFASTNIFLSLLFSAEVGTYFGPSDLTTQIRSALSEGWSEQYLEYCTGLTLIVTMIVTGSAILANYTALGVFKTIGPNNAATILRSDLGLYAAQLPARLSFTSIGLFFTSLVLYWWVNLQKNSSTAALILTLLTLLVLLHVIGTFSRLGRILMATSAMGSVPILPLVEQRKLLPHELSAVLLEESRLSQQLQTPVFVQYRNNNNNVWFENGNNNNATADTITYQWSLTRRYPKLVVDGDGTTDEYCYNNNNNNNC